MTSLGSIALLAALTVAQTESPSGHLKDLQPLVGQWVRIGPAQSDSPAFGPKGTEFSSVITYTWAINKNALQIRWVGKAANKKPVQFIELIGWDAKQKKVVSQGFGSDGAVEHNVWFRKGNTVICDTKGIDAEGKEVTLKYVHTFDGDSMTYRMTDMIVDGEKQPDEEYTYRRVK